MNQFFKPDASKDIVPRQTGSLVVAVEANFNFLSDEYRHLYERSDATAFQAPLWLHKLHTVLAPRLSARQYTLTLRQGQNGPLAALVPFTLQHSMGLTLLQPADFGVSDYNAIVAPKALLEQIAADTSLLAAIDRSLDGHLLLFRKVRDDSFDVARIFKRMAASRAENSAFHTEMGENIEAWKAQLPSKMAKKFEQFSRRIEREHGPFTHGEVTDEADIRSAFALLRRVRANRFERDLLDQDAFFDFYLDYAIEAARCGEASTYVTRINDEIVAMLFGVTGDGIFHGMLIGADTQNWGKFSVGRQVYYNAILDQFRRGKPCLDLSLGDSDYKAMFRVSETKLRNFSAARSMRGAAVAMVYHHAKPLKNRLSRLVPHIR